MCAPRNAVKRHGRVKTLVDSTFATPINSRPHEYGIDLVVQSAFELSSLWPLRPRNGTGAAAKTLAEAADIKLGKILSIEEQSSMPRPMPYGGALRMAAKDASVPLESGENTYRTQVNVIFEIAP